MDIFHLKPYPMNYFHVHLKVADLHKSIAFYNALFNQDATVIKSDYAKWQLENPNVNFAISTADDRRPGLAHLGLEAENGTVLKQLYQQMKRAEGDITEEGDTVCCYAKSEKSWIEDPEGISWEVFYTYGETTFYGSGENTQKAPELMEHWKDHKQQANSCCGT